MTNPYRFPRQPQYAPRRRSAWPYLLALLTVGVVIALFVAAAHIVMHRAAAQSQAASTSLRARGSVDGDGRVTEERTYYYAQSEGFREYADALDAMRDKYLDTGDGALPDLLPEKSLEGLDYYQAWVEWLTDQHAAMLFGDDRVTTDPTEIEDYYDAQIDALDELEQKYLKGQDLDITVRIKQKDGTWRELRTDTLGEQDQDETTRQERQPHQQATQQTAAALTAKWEQALAAVDDSPSADGTYTQAGERLAGAVGLTMNYDYPSLYDHCTMDGRLGDDNTLGAYCPLTPQVVYVNTEATSYARDVRSAYYPSAIRHELAHAMIHRICGTTSPPMGVDAEALTNSYAALYLGADRDQLASGALNASWYAMTDASDEAARQVHAGQCQVS